MIQPAARSPTKDSSSEGWNLLITVRETGAPQAAAGDLGIENQAPVFLFIRFAPSRELGGDEYESRFPELPPRYPGARSWRGAARCLSPQGHGGRRGKQSRRIETAARHVSSERTRPSARVPKSAYPHGWWSASEQPDSGRTADLDLDLHQAFRSVRISSQ